MAEKITVILLMVILFISGVGMLIDVPEMLGIELGLGFNDISSVLTGFWIIMVKAVGLIMALLSVYVIFNIIRD